MRRLPCDRAGSSWRTCRRSARSPSCERSWRAAPLPWPRPSRCCSAPGTLRASRSGPTTAWSATRVSSPRPACWDRKHRPAVDLLDLLIVVFAVSAIVGGFRLGFIARAASWIGLVLGLAIGAHFLPDIVSALRGSPSGNKLLIVAATLIGAGFVGQALGLLVGSSFHARLPLGSVRQVDRVVGAVAGVIGVAVAVWLLLPAMSNVAGLSSQQVRNSAIARGIDGVFPRPP